MFLSAKIFIRLEVSMPIRNAMGMGLLLTCAVLALIGVQHTTHADEPIRFDRDIHPILSENCFACHGPDADKREADLRLDSLEEATRDLGGQVAIVPGNSQASHLIERILSTDPDIQMPPAKSNKNLSLEQRNLLRQWIDQGAHYEGHWSYEPLSRPSVPQNTGAAHPVDAFVRERLIAEGIDPAPRADDITLYRRLAMDLIGDRCISCRYRQRQMGAIHRPTSLKPALRRANGPLVARSGALRR